MACSLSTLKTNACTNGFLAIGQNELLYRLILLQLLCNYSELP